MKRNNILVIKYNSTSIFFKNIDNIEEYYKCSVNNIFMKLLRKINSPFISIFFGKWKKKLKEVDTIILFDSWFNEQIPKYIKKNNNNIRIIFWYWNSVKEYGDKIIENEYIDEIWTYNRFDAKKYNLKYNPQFYLKTRNIENNCIENDVLFMGRNKGREEDLKKLKKKLNNINIKTDFRLIKNANDYIQYDDYLKILEKSKCILDYSFTLPCGLSLRPLEALFYEKKLITNNADIKNYDFYNPDNIFILGENDIEKIHDFINKPYKKIDKEIVQYYSYDSWLNRFGE